MMDAPTLTPRTLTFNTTLLQDAYSNFILAREAMYCTPATITYYKKNLGKIIQWLLAHGIDCPEKISKDHIRTILNELKQNGASDSYAHIYARVFRTFVNFMVDEGYIYQPIKFDMPRVGKKKLLVLDKNKVEGLIDNCINKRDKAIILMLVDTGLRCAELINLNWGDLDLEKGVGYVRCGKGRKDRIILFGKRTKKAIKKYQKDVDSSPEQPLFQTDEHRRFSYGGMRSMMDRIKRRSGIDVTPHALRRSFATISSTNGMDLYVLQELMGHTTLEMTRHYVQMTEEDLMKAYKKHGPMKK
mgnify:FL=1